MNRITLATITLAALTYVGVAQAQDPTPPVAPRPAAPATTPLPSPHAVPSRAARPESPIAPRARDFDDLIDAQRFVDVTRELSRIDRENVITLRDIEMMNANASRAVAMAARNFAPLAVDMKDFAAMAPMVPMTPMAPMAPMLSMTDIAPFANRAWSGDRFRTPPAPWAQGDPADSVYRQARNALTAGEYGRAAKLFAEISKNYPKSSYQNDAQYYEALARYRVGTTDELKQAAKLLEPVASKSNASGSAMMRGVGYDARRNASEADASSLYLRINGQLAQRGDRDAAAIVSKAASTPGAPCDQDDIDVRTQALNALSQMDPAGAAPAIRHVLESKDECTAPLRRNAVFMLARRGDAESSTLLMQVAKSDPSVNVRSEAISYLARIPGDAGVNALEEMLRTEQDERIQRAAVGALMSSDNAKARASMRSLIDRKDAAINLRVAAVNSFNSERSTPDDAKYLRDLYGRADNDRLKQAIISAVGRIGGSDNDQWVMGIVRNQNESSAMRSSALSQLSRSSTISIADLGKLYEGADSRDLRSRVISVLSIRKEPDATDRLIDIVKTSTDVSLRMQAINALQRKNDPRSAQLLLDILDGKRS
jgi:HEAT repeat protein/TolA-binding protein